MTIVEDDEPQKKLLAEAQKQNIQFAFGGTLTVKKLMSSSHITAPQGYNPFNAPSAIVPEKKRRSLAEEILEEQKQKFAKNFNRD